MGLLATPWDASSHDSMESLSIAMDRSLLGTAKLTEFAGSTEKNNLQVILLSDNQCDGSTVSRVMFFRLHRQNHFFVRSGPSAIHKRTDLLDCL